MEWNSHDQEKKGKDGEIGVLVGVLFWMRWGTLIVFWLALFYLNGILSVFGIWDAVFVTWWIFKFDHKNMIICVFILWINFAQSSLFRVLFEKKYVGLKKVRQRRYKRYWLIWAMVPIVSRPDCQEDYSRVNGVDLCRHRFSDILFCLLFYKHIAFDSLDRV